jgi:hypothetical protein
VLTVGAGDVVESDLILFVKLALSFALFGLLLLLDFVDARRRIVLIASTRGESAESTCKRSCWEKD